MKTKTDPWAALDALIKTTPEPVGPEWFTVEDFAVRYGYGRANAASKLEALHRAGKIMRWKGLVVVSRRITTKWRLA